MHWNIQEFLAWKTVSAICAPAFSRPIIAEHKANIRTHTWKVSKLFLHCTLCFKSQYCLNSINKSFLLLKHTRSKTHAKSCTCRIKISISMWEERKHLHKTASTHMKRPFLFGVVQCHCGVSKLLWALRISYQMRDFLRKKKSGGGRVQSVQVCSRQLHFLPYRQESVRARHSNVVFTQYFPRTVMQSNSNGVIQSSCLSQQ